MLITLGSAYAPTRRTTALENMPKVRWCKSKCTGTACDGGTYGNYQKRIYALAVAINLNGDSRCHCGAEISLWNGEVDRTEKGCYRPGFIVMTCHGCNNDRTHFPNFDNDRFRNDVLIASRHVEIVGQTEAKEMYLAGREIGSTLRLSRYFR